MAREAHAHESGWQIFDLGAMLGGTWAALTWQSSALLLAFSAYLLARAAVYSAEALRQCGMAWRAWRRK